MKIIVQIPATNLTIWRHALPFTRPNLAHTGFSALKKIVNPGGIYHVLDWVIATLKRIPYSVNLVPGSAHCVLPPNYPLSKPDHATKPDEEDGNLTKKVESVVKKFKTTNVCTKIEEMYQN